jgi:lipid-A-disaccharide synthase
MSGPLRIGLVAGEASGDLLGAALIAAVRRLQPEVEFAGVAGPRMRALGCKALGSTDELAVMGFVEPLRHLPRLWRLRRRLLRSFLEWDLDVFVGIDSPAFNLGLANSLRRRGCVTVQYVSPQVWAWRQGRVRKIARAVDCVLCLLPFEAAFYASHSVRAEFVGHPLADQVPLQPDRDAARRELGLAAADRVVAVLPGSRVGEVQRLGADFAAATLLLAGSMSPPPKFVAAMASPRLAAIFRRQVEAAGARIGIYDGHADQILASADSALVASGTATLQAMLHGCPMVVAYRLAPLTAFIARELGVVKVRHFSQPNLLAGEALVPEFFQEAATPQALADALRSSLTDGARREILLSRFRAIHVQLRLDAAARAAQIVLELAARHRDSQQGRP